MEGFKSTLLLSLNTKEYRHAMKKAVTDDAGMQEGGLCLWDYEEADSRSSFCNVDGASVQCQRPTFTSECHGSPGMAGAVVSVAVLPQLHVQAGQSNSKSLCDSCAHTEAPG